jgi:hypothetical protein
MRTLLQDATFAFRQLRKNPAFALTAIISLVLGIGATTAVFSLVYAVLMNPYPYRDSGQLVYLMLKDKAGTALRDFRPEQPRGASSARQLRQP